MEVKCLEEEVPCFFCLHKCSVWASGGLNLDKLHNSFGLQVKILIPTSLNWLTVLDMSGIWSAFKKCF